MTVHRTCSSAAVVASCCNCIDAVVAVCSFHSSCGFAFVIAFNFVALFCCFKLFLLLLLLFFW